MRSLFLYRTWLELPGKRVGVVETPFSAWKADVLTVILNPHKRSKLPPKLSQGIEPCSMVYKTIASPQCLPSVKKGRRSNPIIVVCLVSKLTPSRNRRKSLLDSVELGPQKQRRRGQVFDQRRKGHDRSPGSQLNVYRESPEDEFPWANKGGQL